MTGVANNPVSVPENFILSALAKIASADKMNKVGRQLGKRGVRRIVSALMRRRAPRWVIRTRLGGAFVSR